LKDIPFWVNNNKRQNFSKKEEKKAVGTILTRTLIRKIIRGQVSTWLSFQSKQSQGRGGGGGPQRFRYLLQEHLPISLSQVFPIKPPWTASLLHHLFGTISETLPNLQSEVTGERRSSSRFPLLRANPLA